VVSVSTTSPFAHLEKMAGLQVLVAFLNYGAPPPHRPRAAERHRAVVDSDYPDRPQASSELCAPDLRRPQAGSGSSRRPQDTAAGCSPPTNRRLYYSYKYFFAVSQPSRNEHDAADIRGDDGA